MYCSKHKTQNILQGSLLIITETTQILDDTAISDLKFKSWLLKIQFILHCLHHYFCGGFVIIIVSTVKTLSGCSVYHDDSTNSIRGSKCNTLYSIPFTHFGLVLALPMKNMQVSLICNYAIKLSCSLNIVCNIVNSSSPCLFKHSSILEIHCSKSCT